MYFSTLWTTTSFITCMKAAKVSTLVRIFLKIPGWWYAVVNVDCWWGHTVWKLRKNTLTYFWQKFRESNVSILFLQNSWFDEIFVISIREDLLFSHTVGPKGHDRNHLPKNAQRPNLGPLRKNGVSLERFRRRIVHWSEKCTYFCSFFSFFLENTYIKSLKNGSTSYHWKKGQK